jgi:uncharacterized membrane protein
MDILLILLRILHIIAGVLWVGGALHFFLFIGPSVQATAPESQKFMAHLMTQKRWSQFMSAMSLLTVLAGGALYYRLGSVNWRWVTTGPGIGFTIGALAGLLVLAAGVFIIGPRTNRLARISQEIQMNGGSPSANQVAILQRTQRELEILGKVNFVLILIALLTMSTARYWTF